MPFKLKEELVTLMVSASLPMVMSLRTLMVTQGEEQLRALTSAIACTRVPTSTTSILTGGGATSTGTGTAAGSITVGVTVMGTVEAGSVVVAVVGRATVLDPVVVAVVAAGSVAVVLGGNVGSYSAWLLRFSKMFNN